ncbi:hypothetical protein LEP1GSC133_0103 [Leptospira borgpetersenii serovar Pomona str. 200901868]|uniref:Uncharacterized protein n=1 Tax=Leptospira borgpetersenii serovar Pomona str. 200901868 TaxID=1192866 RepID=M6W4R2_LEPBO|nr:hypothetical protein LEP1GSC133_0103 [Leptospira borgpetersenii serovar Pomona str. 200901868]
MQIETESAVFLRGSEEKFVHFPQSSESRKLYQTNRVGRENSGESGREGSAGRKRTIYLELTKKITQTTNGETIAYNVETNIYRTVLNDYMGESGVVSQIFNAELQQRAGEQKLQWNLKEQEFYDLKSDWIQNISYLKQTGTKDGKTWCRSSKENGKTGETTLKPNTKQTKRFT